jgi:hypothetical protein
MLKVDLGFKPCAETVGVEDVAAGLGLDDSGRVECDGGTGGDILEVWAQ